MIRQTTSLPFTAYESPNFNNGSFRLDMRWIVLHTEQGFKAGTRAEFANSNEARSAHYAVNLDGSIDKYVNEDCVAWHCGVAGVPNSYLWNQISIGIEHEDDNKPYDIVRTPEQLEKSAQLVADIAKFYGIPLVILDSIDTNKKGILPHHLLNPGKGCPGNLPIEQIVKRAQEILASSGQSIKPVDTINSMQVTSRAGNITVISGIGLKLRSTPNTKDNNFIKSVPKGTVLSVEGFVVGEDVSIASVATTDKWWKLAGHEVYGWSGGTNVIPEVPVVPTPAPVIETPTVTPPAVVQPQEDTDHLKSQIDELTSQNKQLHDNVSILSNTLASFNAGGFSTLDDITKALNEKDSVIQGINTQLVQSQQRNISLADLLKKKEEEDYTAITEGLGAKKESDKIKSDLVDLAQVVGSDPTVQSITNRITSLVAQAQQALKSPQNRQDTNTDVPQLPNRGIFSTVLHFLHLN